MVTSRSLGLWNTWLHFKGIPPILGICTSQRISLRLKKPSSEELISGVALEVLHVVMLIAQHPHGLPFLILFQCLLNVVIDPAVIMALVFKVL